MGREFPPEAARLHVTTEARVPRLSASSAQPASPCGSPTAAARCRPTDLSRTSSSSHTPKYGLQPAEAAGMAMPPADSMGGAAPGEWRTSADAQQRQRLPLESQASQLLTVASIDTPHGQGVSPRSSSSGQASPRFLYMLRASLPDETAADSDSSGPAPSNNTLAMLQSIGRRNPDAAPPVDGMVMFNGGGAGAVAALPAGKQHKRGFFGMFKSNKGGQQQLEHVQQSEVGGSAAGMREVGNGSSKQPGSGGGGKKKGGSSWFGSKSASASASADAERAAAAAATAGSTQQQQQQQQHTLHQQRADSGVLLPGLPLTEAGAAVGGYGGSGSARSLAASSAGGSSSVEGGGGSGPNSRHSLAGGARQVASYPVGYTDVSDMSAPSTADPSPAVPLLGLPPDVDMSGGKKGVHRRQRSLTSLLLKPGWRRRSRQTSAGSEAELCVEPMTPGGGGSHGGSRAGSPAPTTAEALAAAAGYGGSASHLGGYGSRHASAEGDMAVMPLVEEEPLPLLPAGTAGLRNIGNTCFVNAALQCLRYTPGLPLHVVPDLLERAQQQLEQGGQQQQQQQQPGGAATAAGGSPFSNGGGGGAPPPLQQQQQGGGAQGAPPAAVDVHKQALARASMEVSREEVERARRALQEASASAAAFEACGGAAVGAAAGGSSSSADGGGAAAAAVPATPDQAAPAGDQRLQQQQQLQAKPPPAAPGKPQRPPKGALLASFAGLVQQLYLQPAKDGPVCAAPLLRTLRAFPIAADYFDGGQHDCQEVLRVMMDLLHDDLNRAQQPQQQASLQAVPAEEAGQQDGAAAAAATAAEQQQGEAAPDADGTLPSPPQQQQQQLPEGAQQQQEQQQPEQQVQHQQQVAAVPEVPAAAVAAPEPVMAASAFAGAPALEGQIEEHEDEDEKADRLWQQYHERDSSVITDLFGGQLQSSVTCHKCGGRFTMYEPFWDLSLPLAKESKSGSFSWLGLKGVPASIQDCLTAFTADEKLEGGEAFHCETCGEKTHATKHLRVHRFPEVLVLHIKRFKYKGASTDKLSANVSFPLKDLRLHQYASPECPAGPQECCYELYAVSNHYGNLTGGHYTAMCRVPQAGGDEAWYSFNDEQVACVNPSQVVSQYAYILFYARSRTSTAAAAAGQLQRHHRRNSSAASGSFM